MENVTSSEYKLSSCNSAGNLIKRLDELWTAAHKDVRVGNYHDWNVILDRLWLEIAGDLPEDSTENTKMDSFNTEIVKLLPLPSGNMSGFNKKDKVDYDKLSKQFLSLKKKERYIKFTEAKLGLNKDYVDEMEDDWD